MAEHATMLRLASLIYIARSAYVPRKQNKLCKPKNWLKQLIRTGYVRRMQRPALRESFAYASRKELVRNLFAKNIANRAILS